MGTPDGTLWATNGSGIHRKTSAAQSFQQLIGNTGYAVFLVVIGQEVWAGLNGGGLQRSLDNGEHWESVGSPSMCVTALARNPADHSMVVATDDLGVLTFSP